MSRRRGQQPGPQRARERKARLADTTTPGYDTAWARWETDCQRTGQQPLTPVPAAVRDHLVALAGTDTHPGPGPGTLRSVLAAIKRKHWEHRHTHAVAPDLYLPAERFLAALHNARPGRTLAPTPPMLRADVAALADHPGTSGRALPPQIARGRAALLALHTGTPPDLLWRAAPPPQGHVGGTGPLTLDAPGADGVPDTTIELTDTPPGPGLPSPAGAARDLALHVPPGTAKLLGIGARGNGPHDPAYALPQQDNTKNVVLAQLRRAAARARIPWTAPEDLALLTPDQLRLLDRALHPDLVTAPRDHAIRTTGHATSLRGKNLRDIDRTDTHRTGTGPGSRWHIHIRHSKTYDIDDHTLVLEPHDNPDVCPVRALDALVAVLTELGHTHGPLFPGTSSNGRITGEPMGAKRINSAVGPHHTSRSLRVGATTQAHQDGHDHQHLEKLTRNNTRNVGHYLRDVVPYALKL